MSEVCDPGGVVEDGEFALTFTEYGEYGDKAWRSWNGTYLQQCSSEGDAWLLISLLVGSAT
jgi:hypothetical protein